MLSNNDHFPLSIYNSHPHPAPGGHALQMRQNKYFVTRGGGIEWYEGQTGMGKGCIGMGGVERNGRGAGSLVIPGAPVVHP
jgi:hypothetical protein